MTARHPPKLHRRPPPPGRRGYSRKMEADIAYTLEETRLRPWVKKPKPPR